MCRYDGVAAVTFVCVIAFYGVIIVTVYYGISRQGTEAGRQSRHAAHQG
jgi:hypothetical protein